MNLSLEAYDWWATQVPTKYQTLETNSESDQSFDNINEEKKYDLFDEYIQVWVLPHPLIFNLPLSPVWTKLPRYSPVYTNPSK